MVGQKAQLDIKKPDGEMAMLVIVLVRGINYGRSGNRKTQVRRSN